MIQFKPTHRLKVIGHKFYIGPLMRRETICKINQCKNTAIDPNTSKNWSIYNSVHIFELIEVDPDPEPDTTAELKNSKKYLESYRSLVIDLKLVARVTNSIKAIENVLENGYTPDRKENGFTVS